LAAASTVSISRVFVRDAMKEEKEKERRERSYGDI